MSLRAIKKRETQNNLNGSTTGPKQTIFRKANSSINQHSTSHAQNSKKVTNALKSISSALNSKYQLRNQYKLLGRITRSNPELSTVWNIRENTHNTHLVRTKSENDISNLLKSCSKNGTDINGRQLFGAKSEVCLQTIASHNYSAHQLAQSRTQQSGIINNNSRNINTDVNSNSNSNSDSREMSQSYTTMSSSCSSSSPTYDTAMSPTRRRMSESSLHSNSMYSQRTNAMSGSALTLASNASEPNSVMRVPIIGYEVMEERARFTVYKLRVENPVTNDCWLVLRRYTDFVRLNSKVKQIFPHLNLILPRKKIFGDNFNSVFLDNRVQGLQIFVNSIMAKDELRKCKFVREFFCLDEPPTCSESMEECRAIFEAQEETITHLKMQINNKNDLILTLQQQLRLEIAEKESLREALKNLSAKFAAMTTSAPANSDRALNTD